MSLMEKRKYKQSTQIWLLCNAVFNYTISKKKICVSHVERHILQGDACVCEDSEMWRECRKHERFYVSASCLRRRMLPKRLLMAPPTVLPVVLLRLTPDASVTPVGDMSGASAGPALWVRWREVISMPLSPVRLWSFRAFSMVYEGSPLPLRSSGWYSYKQLETPGWRNW